MRILVITDVLWRNDNGVGNSYSNIFDGMPGIEVSNICCQEGVSENLISHQCFQISEARLLNNLRNKSVSSGIVENREDSKKIEESVGKKSCVVKYLKRSRFQILFWIRNMIWKIGHWKSKELKKFIDDFNPDIVFAQLQDKVYLNNVVSFVKDYTQKPLVLYAWDDIYSMKQFSFSPLFWADRLYQRKSIRKLVHKSSILYTISAEQKAEYNRTLNIRTELLFKGKIFNNKPEIKHNDGCLQILYTGNLYSGRLDTIIQLCKKLHEINRQKLIAELHIYSGTDLSKKQINQINKYIGSYFHGRVSENEVKNLQNKADILLHIEPMSLRGSLLCRLSFSTKLVDYFYNAKCIFAVGSKRCSSMRYLKKYDAAIVSYDLKQAEEALEHLLENRDLIEEYSNKSWICGYNNHQIEEIQQRILADFVSLMNGIKE